jgi:hypothetical protein
MATDSGIFGCELGSVSKTVIKFRVLGKVFAPVRILHAIPSSFSSAAAELRNSTPGIDNINFCSRVCLWAFILQHRRAQYVLAV